MTGETENGRSISVVRKALPLNSNLAIAQAAATPKTRLQGTAMAATVSVSLIAANVSGSSSAKQEFTRALAEGFDEHDDQRQDQEKSQENQGNSDQNRLGRGRFGGRARGYCLAHSGNRTSRATDPAKPCRSPQPP